MLPFENIFYIVHDLQSVMTSNELIANALFYSRAIVLLIMIDFCIVHLKYCIGGLINVANMLIV